jgi:hypothetical protein
MAPGTVASTYQDGKLTIMARNARLIDVLYSACDLIGADLNVPESANQPILRIVGPAAPREVLVSLLRSSAFDYAMTGSAKDPNVIASLSVFAKDKDKAKDSDATDAPSIAKQMADLFARGQAEQGSAATNVDSSQANETGAGNADASESIVDVAKALNDPNLVSLLQTLSKSPDQAGTQGNSDVAQQPASAPSDFGVQHRRGHHQ